MPHLHVEGPPEDVEAGLVVAQPLGVHVQEHIGGRQVCAEAGECEALVLGHVRARLRDVHLCAE